MTFYVDSIIADGRIGLADSQQNIAYDNLLLGQKYVDTLTDTVIEHNVASTVGYVGRYLYATEISLDQFISKITFVDCCKDVQLAMDMALEFMKISEEYSQKFITAFAQQSTVYDQIYNDVILVVGQAPSLVP